MTRARTSAALAVTLAAALSTTAYAQRSPRAGSLPRATTSSAPPRAAPGPRPTGPGVAVVPRGRPGGGIERRSGDLPRIVTVPPRRSGSRFDPRFDPRGRSRFGTHSGTRIGTTFGTAVTRRPFARSIVKSGCGFGCMCGIRGCVPVTFVGAHFGFAIPIPLTYESYYSSSYSVAGDYATDAAQADPEPARSKVIIVGAGGGDALTVESLTDSVRLTWLATGKPVREVRLFLTDSAQRQLASRSASPTNPRATFETATLSAPVAFIGVTVVFMDGVSSTTVVPYRREEGR